MKNLLVVITILSTLNTFYLEGQKYSVLPTHRNVTIFRPDSVIEVSILINKNPNIRCERDKSYFWYAFDQIHVNQGEFSGYLLDGQLQLFNNTHVMFESGHFRMGLKHGKWLKWSIKGLLVEESNWDDGLKQGYRLLYKDNSLIRREHYHHGLLDGKVTNVLTDGEVEKIVYQNGELSKRYLKKQKKEEKESLQKTEKKVTYRERRAIRKAEKEENKRAKGQQKDDTLKEKKAARELLLKK